MNRRRFMLGTVAAAVSAALPSLPEPTPLRRFMAVDWARPGSDMTAAVKAFVDGKGVLHYTAISFHELYRD